MTRDSFTRLKRRPRTVTGVHEEHTAGALALQLGHRERAVLGALVGRAGQVVDRDQLRHDAGLDELSPRRCDAILVGIRRTLGPGSVVTVRRRGWRLHPDVLAAALAILSSFG